MFKRLKPIYPRSFFEVTADFFSLVSLLFLWGFAVTSWPTLPETIPIHFGISGQPDGWGAKGLVFFVPAAALLLFALLTAAPLFPEKPEMAALPPEEKARQMGLARKLLFAIKAETLVCFLYLGTSVVRVARREMGSLGAWFAPVFLCLIFGTIGLFLYALKRGRRPPTFS
jgi:uncharacterized membrane protein